MRHVVEKIENSHVGKDLATVKRIFRYFKQSGMINLLPDDIHLIKAVPTSFGTYFDVTVRF